MKPETKMIAPQTFARDTAEGKAMLEKANSKCLSLNPFLQHFRHELSADEKALVEKMLEEHKWFPPPPWVPPGEQPETPAYPQTIASDFPSMSGPSLMSFHRFCLSQLKKAEVDDPVAMFAATGLPNSQVLGIFEDYDWWVRDGFKGSYDPEGLTMVTRIMKILIEEYDSDIQNWSDIQR